MSKELEALERGIIEFEKDLEDDCNNEWLKRVVAGMKKCYQRLEAIDNLMKKYEIEDIEDLEVILADYDDMAKDIVEMGLGVKVILKGGTS